jgi:hypothetical protein
LRAGALGRTGIAINHRRGGDIRKKFRYAVVACLVLASVLGVPSALAGTTAEMDGSLAAALLRVDAGIDADGDGVLTVEELGRVSGALDLSHQTFTDLRELNTSPVLPN